MSKVLLTRPTFDGLETSKVLETINIESLCIPLLEIKKKIHKISIKSTYINSKHTHTLFFSQNIKNPFDIRRKKKKKIAT